MLLAGALWFLPNFATVGTGWLAWLAAKSAVVHRAVLFHAIMAFPSGRIGRRLDAAAVVLAYGIALIDASRAEAGALVWAVAAVIAFVAINRLRTGPARTAGLRALPTMVLLSVVIGGTGALLLVVGNFPAPPVIVDAYGAGLVAVGFVLLFNVHEYRARLERVRMPRSSSPRDPPGTCENCWRRHCATLASRSPSPLTMAARPPGSTNSDVKFSRCRPRVRGPSFPFGLTDARWRSSPASRRSSMSRA